MSVYEERCNANGPLLRSCSMAIGTPKSTHATATRSLPNGKQSTPAEKLTTRKGFLPTRPCDADEWQVAVPIPARPIRRRTDRSFSNNGEFMVPPTPGPGEVPAAL